MKKWNFIVKSNPDEIIKKLDSDFEPVKGMVFNINHDKNGSIVFKLRKRIQDSNAIMQENLTIVHGRMLKTENENETDVEISFKQHFLRIFYVSIFLIFGLLAIILGIIGSTTLFIIAVFILAIGIASSIVARKGFRRDIRKYKTLISKTLEV